MNSNFPDITPRPDNETVRAFIAFLRERFSDDELATQNLAKAVTDFLSGASC